MSDQAHQGAGRAALDCDRAVSHSHPLQADPCVLT